MGSERLAERGWGKPKQDVVIDDDRETSGFRIVYRQWPEGYDPMSKGEKPYQGKVIPGKLALPSLKPMSGPFPDGTSNDKGVDKNGSRRNYCNSNGHNGQNGAH